MVLMESRIARQTYEVFDDQLHRIGEIVRPVSPRLLGAGEGTVYLVRTMKGGEGLKD